MSAPAIDDLLVRLTRRCENVTTADELRERLARSAADFVFARTLR